MLSDTASWDYVANELSSEVDRVFLSGKAQSLEAVRGPGQKNRPVARCVSRAVGVLYHPGEQSVHRLDRVEGHQPDTELIDVAF